MFGGDFVWGSKYSPEGRDGDSVFLGFFIGGCSMAYGWFQWFISKANIDEEKIEK